MDGQILVSELSDDFVIPYKKGKMMANFINALVEILPQESRFYNTSKETYIKDNIENMMGIMRAED